MERLELITIIMFGEAIIGITGFFNLTDPQTIGVMSFMVIILMFASYVVQIHYLCDHERVVRSNTMIWCLTYC